MADRGATAGTNIRGTSLARCRVASPLMQRSFGTGLPAITLHGVFVRSTIGACGQLYWHAVRSAPVGVRPSLLRATKVAESVKPGMIKAKTQLHSRVVRAVTVGDVAQLYTDFEGTTVDSSGKTTPLHDKAIEVLRRQTDGGWKLIMGGPAALF